MTFKSISRNKTAVLTLLCASLTFTGCFREDLSEELTRETNTYTGEFKSLGGVEVQEVITHLFETDDGEILYAYSERYNLDSDDYFSTRVEAYGVVTTHENLDKPLFEVKRITEAGEEEEDAEEVTQVDYQDPDLGFSMTYPSNWGLTPTPTSVILEAPLVVEESDEEEELVALPEETLTRDRIVVARLDAVLSKTNEDPQDDRALEIRTYASSEYSQEIGSVQSELTYVGPDRLFSVRYKTTDGDIFYFIPRGEELLELSYHHETESDSERLENSNTFSTLASGFRFTPVGEGEVKPSETEDTVEPEKTEEPTPTPTGDQVSFKSYRELESKPYEFKMSYPGAWYYNGTSSGYNFGDSPENVEGTEPILKMLFNQSTTEGVKTSGTTVSITVEHGGRYYTISGPAEYQSAMQIMADSITSTATDDEE